MYTLTYDLVDTTELEELFESNYLKLDVEKADDSVFVLEGRLTQHTDWEALSVINMGAMEVTSTISKNGIFEVDVSAMNAFRLRMLTYSGTPAKVTVKVA